RYLRDHVPRAGFVPRPPSSRPRRSCRRSAIGAEESSKWGSDAREPDLRFWMARQQAAGSRKIARVDLVVPAFDVDGYVVPFIGGRDARPNLIIIDHIPATRDLLNGVTCCSHRRSVSSHIHPVAALTPL